MIKRFLICFGFLICVSFTAVAQEFNQKDAQGQRHGDWQKYYEGTKQLRYSGTFDHGREIGTFTFYDKTGGHPTAIKIYTMGSDLLDVIYYTKSGKKISEGKMKGRSKEGEWTYYHKDGTSVMTTEVYQNNLLEGMRTVFFESGVRAQETQYNKGMRQGLDFHYNEKGTVLKKFIYKRDKLEGPASFYNYDGSLLREGQYKNNRKHGAWKYYVNGTLDKTVKFPQNKIGVYH